jgi:hypothetical protein
VTKEKLLRLLQPFTDEIEISVYEQGYAAHGVNEPQLHYQMQANGEAHIVIAPTDISHQERTVRLTR